MEKEKCCGCSACEQICPVQCIVMEKDEKGFLYPKTDLEKCLHCRKCDRVCPAEQSADKKQAVQIDTFVGYTKKENVRKNSSSGGIFSVLAECVLDQNGVVFGAAFDKDFSVHHIFVESKKDLWKLQGSKYVQSNLENTYRETKQFLETGRLVLFSGTACQISGLQNYLGKLYEMLYTVDVLCHGVPNPEIWKRYLEEKRSEYGQEIQKIEFRNKQQGWKNYSVNIIFANGLSYGKVHHEDVFMKLFLSDICLRSSCYQCTWKRIPRDSDLSLGDCWGVERIMPEMDDDNGTSVILVHSQKGKWLLENVRDELNLRNAQLDTVLPPQADSRRSVLHHPNEKKFWKAAKQGEPISKLEQYAERSFIQKVIGVVQNKIRR